MAKIKKIKLPNNIAYDISDSGAVRFDEGQSLTDAQKLQARNNIGIGDLSGAMRFIGRATVNIIDGSTTDPKISGYNTKQSGDVILNKDDQREMIWTGSTWEELGKEGDYVIKESGKGLSTNDFTNADKQKLDNLNANAEPNVQSDWNESDTTSNAYILNKPSEYTADEIQTLWNNIFI